MDVLGNKFAQLVEQLIAQGDYKFLALIGIIMCLYFFKSEISKLIGWILSRRLSKIKDMLDSGWLDTELSLELQEQYNQICFQNTRKFCADKNLRLKIFSLLKQDTSLSMFDFRRSREYFDFKNDVFTFKITSWHYLFTSVIMVIAIIWSCLWLALYFSFFTDVHVSMVQWVSRIILLIFLGSFDAILLWEISKFLGARKLNLKINNQAMPSIRRFWLNQLSSAFIILKLKK